MSFSGYVDMGAKQPVATAVAAFSSDGTNSKGLQKRKRVLPSKMKIKFATCEEEKRAIGHAYVNHEGKRVCGECGKSVFSSAGLATHIQHLHGLNKKVLPSNSTAQSAICEEEKRAIQNAYINGDGKRVCGECNKSLRTPGELDVHIKRNHGKRLFGCRVCRQSYTFKKQFVAHAHTDEHREQQFKRWIRKHPRKAAMRQIKSFREFKYILDCNEFDEEERKYISTFIHLSPKQELVEFYYDTNGHVVRIR
jgi:hypothetical protein